MVNSSQERSISLRIEVFGVILITSLSMGQVGMRVIDTAHSAAL